LNGLTQHIRLGLTILVGLVLALVPVMQARATAPVQPEKPTCCGGQCHCPQAGKTADPDSRGCGCGVDRTETPPEAPLHVVMPESPDLRPIVVEQPPELRVAESESYAPVLSPVSEADTHPPPLYNSHCSFLI